MIGYSMPETDAFFKFLLTLGLAENDGLYKLIVVDRVLQAPTADEVTIEKRWRNMLEGVFVKRRFHFFDRGVAEFMKGPIQYHLRRGEQVNMS